MMKLQKHGDVGTWYGSTYAITNVDLLAMWDYMSVRKSSKSYHSKDLTSCIIRRSIYCIFMYINGKY